MITNNTMFEAEEVIGGSLIGAAKLDNAGIKADTFWIITLYLLHEPAERTTTRVVEKHYGVSAG